jgi:hypothetical protein
VGAHASVLTVRVASGTTYEFTFAAVRAGRTVEVLSMVAAPGAVSAQELQKVAAAADARLRGRPQPPSA